MFGRSSSQRWHFASSGLLALIPLGFGCSSGTTAYPEAVKPDNVADEVLPKVPLPRLHVEGNELKNEAGETVILRGVSTVDLGTTNRYPGGAIGMIDRLTNKSDAQGASVGWYTTVIRLAIYPANSSSSQSPFTYAPNSTAFYDTLLRPVVDRCQQRGVYAIIDWHGIGDTGVDREATAAFWRDMAPRFANDPHVLFELFNEPVNRTASNRNGDWTSVRSDMQYWYDIVRSAAPENLVLVGTPSWCQVIGDTADTPIDGYNIAYVAHIYPMHFAWSSALDGIRRAKAAHPVFMTEWGFQDDVADDSQGRIVKGTISSYGRPYRDLVEGLGLSWTAWCASSDWLPSMFDSSFGLLVGEGYMGGFTKDWLWETRNTNPPLPFD